MSRERRHFLQQSLGFAAGVFTSSIIPLNAREWITSLFSDDASLRRSFSLDPESIHLAGLLLASPPASVQNTVQVHTEALLQNPTHYLTEKNAQLQDEARQAIAEYTGTRAQDIALTDSTTMGIALVYQGFEFKSGDEVLTTTHDYYSTHASLEFRQQRDGVALRKIQLYENIPTVTQEEILHNLRDSIRPQTRLLALTWVHSSTGLKLPIRAIADLVQSINAERSNREKLYLAVDGVHGLGVEDCDLSDLGCDFFMAGAHKWMLAPGGTGILWARPEAQDQVSPTIPTFSNDQGWGPWMSPGGFKAFENLWAMAEAFRFHQGLGRSNVASHIHRMAHRLKVGLANMSKVELHTPMDPGLSSGIVCFTIRSLSADETIAKLRTQGVIGSVTPYDVSYARFTPGVYNSAAEMDRVLEIVSGL